MTKKLQSSYERVETLRKAVADSRAWIEETDYAASYGNNANYWRNCNSSALLLKEKALARAEKSLAAVLDPKPSRDVASDLQDFLVNHDSFDVGFVNHGRTGPHDTPQKRGVDRDTVVAYIHKVMRVPSCTHFVYGRKDGLVHRFGFDSRHKSLAGFQYQHQEPTRNTSDMVSIDRSL